MKTCQPQTSRHLLECIARAAVPWFGFGIPVALLCLGWACECRALTSEAPLFPDPLLASNQTRINTPDQWQLQCRPQLLETFRREMYGCVPARPKEMKFCLLEENKNALNGKAIRRQARILLSGNAEGPFLDLLLYLPQSADRTKAPAILAINFWGNHAIHPDQGILITTNWMDSGRNGYVDLSGVTNHLATEACRGVNASQWPVDRFLEKGYGFATFYRGDVTIDSAAAVTNGVLAGYPELQKRPDNFATIGAWAWSLSRALDYLETDPAVDAKRVAVFGWSRLGKAALWAGATDERFAAVISHQSGAGGAKLFRRGVGDDITRLNTVFPHWYCRSFRKYNGQDKNLPFDQNLVISLIAPRPVYVGSAEQDKGADPEGEFLGALGANSVYLLLGCPGLPSTDWPPVNQSIQGRIGYHVRSGNHGVTEYDWTQYLSFLDKYFAPR
jgi:hypothetical protein